MDIEKVKNNISNKIPMFIGEKQIEVVHVLDMFNLLEVKVNGQIDTIIIDSFILIPKPIKEKRIPIELFIERVKL
ncbi:MAG: hypothetical protein E6441_12845 [Clostridium sp.]|uniref:hypothetical protein n=1 Tax=Clostridium sp. TaxID=1506 RepID=UPI002906DB1C|nr:hypothetical protein [Clostridium sp.]MDU4787618.1 hypothetical protein [Clostridium sp.]MDU5210217.1 hypothetical protein [Clostridium sp.]MDU6762344.1 hypothetical protein [Clostridium sp.]